MGAGAHTGVGGRIFAPTIPLHRMDVTSVKQVDAKIGDALERQLAYQRATLTLVASANYLSPAVLAAQGSTLASERAEGYPGARYFAGTEQIDRVETAAIERAQRLFDAPHANVQPHSGTSANMGVYVGMLNPGDTILSLQLDHGGHLSHGHHVNFAGQYYEIEQYGVDLDSGVIDYDALAETAHAVEPDLIVTGFSAYPRTVEWARVGEIAREVDAYHLADVAHTTGLIAGGVHPNPIEHADFVTGSTHKSLRAGRGGMILCHEEHAAAIDSGVFPGAQGDPLMHNIAGKAVGFAEALAPDFARYAAAVIENATVLAKTLRVAGFELVSGGTDTHLILIDLQRTHPELTGKAAETALEAGGIVLNANPVPGDPRPPRLTSGIRVGTAAVTTRGLGPEQMRTIGQLIADQLAAPGDTEVTAQVASEVAALCAAFPLYRSFE